MKTATYTLPAHWASALVNGDYSGLDDQEEREINSWLERHPELEGCLDCGEETWFSRHNDAGTLAGDVCEFTFPVKKVRRDRPEPCRCERLHFPHRRDWRCIEFRWEQEVAASDDLAQAEREQLISDIRADVNAVNSGR